MSRYQMLVGVDEERVAKVGGKAAILEEILRRWPQANIPPFQVVENENQLSFIWGQEKRIFRASSHLDVLGGFGLHDSYAEVNLPERVMDSYRRIVNQDELNQQRIDLYAESIGAESGKPVVLSQIQKAPLYWMIVMQHPNNPNYYLVSYSSSQSRETRKAGFANMFGNLAYIVERLNPDFVFRGITYQALFPNKGAIKGELDDKIGEDAVVLGVINYIVLQDLGIVHPDFVSIAELGIYKDRTETYQFTPVRKRLKDAATVTDDKLVFGSLETEELPIVKIPSAFSVRAYLRSGHGLDNFPEFSRFIEPRVKQFGLSMAHFDFGDFLTWDFMKMVEQQYPNGYMVIAEVDSGQQFDITMRNARAVLLDTEKHPASALNHSISRLLYKTPSIVIGPIKESEQLKHGQVVKFSSDGSSYSIKA